MAVHTSVMSSAYGQEPGDTVTLDRVPSVTDQPEKRDHVLVEVRDG